MPAACVGFDSTTERRIRIPREIIDQHSAFETKGFLSLAGNDRIIFEPFFSVREFGIFTKMDVVGIRFDETTYAILLTAWTEEEQIGSVREYTPLRPEYGAKLFSCYSAKLMGLLPPPYFDDLEQAAKSLDPTLSRYREAGRIIHLCNVDLQILLETVQPTTGSADIFRFTEDVLRMLFSLVSATGIYYRKSETEITLGFATTTAQDSQFLAHHLRLSISDFFPQTTLPDSTITSWRSVQPEEIPDPPSALFA
jgi:hypothetical protein